MSGIAQHLQQLCFAPVPAKRLTLWVRWFTTSFILYISARLEYADEWLTDFGFHLTKENMYTSYLFHAPTMDSWLVPWFIGSFLTTCGLFLIFPRNTILRWMMFTLALYVQGVDTLSAHTINKLYVISFFIYALPVSSQLSKSQLIISAWPLRLLQATLLLLYFTAGTCKIFHGSWLKDPDILWTHVQGFYRTEFAAWLVRILPKWVWHIQMNLALSFELLAPILLGVRPLRLVGILVGIGFHLMIALTMHELIFFSFQMMSFYLLFEDPRKPSK